MVMSMHNQPTLVVIPTFFAGQHLVSYCFIYRTKINHYFYAA